MNDLRKYPLVESRQKLNPIDSHVVNAALSLAVSVGAGVISRWAWEQIHNRKKTKNKNTVQSETIRGFRDEFTIELNDIVTISRKRTVRIVRTKLR
jgi:hypothetical protein